MSITVERPISSTARAEYSARTLANKLKRPRLMKGAPRAQTPADKMDRRDSTGYFGKLSIACPARSAMITDADAQPTSLWAVGGLSARKSSWTRSVAEEYVGPRPVARPGGVRPTNECSSFRSGGKVFPWSFPAHSITQFWNVLPRLLCRDAVAAIEDGLVHPIAGPSLAALAAGKRTAAISVCDITRPAPNPVVLPPLLRHLEGMRQIPRENIRILIATGLHRPATDGEIRQIVGPDVAAPVPRLESRREKSRAAPALGHNPLRYAGMDRRTFYQRRPAPDPGIYRAAPDAGILRRAKADRPGIGEAEATIKQLHSPRFNRDPRVREASIVDNPLHAELLEIAGMARHDFIVDVSLTRDRRISAVFAGEPVAAHRAGVQWVSSALMQDVGQPADAVITTSAGYPLDLTFYQSVKGVTAASQIVRQGGRILLFGACEEGRGRARSSVAMLARLRFRRKSS